MPSPRNVRLPPGAATTVTLPGDDGTRIVSARTTSPLAAGAKVRSPTYVPRRRSRRPRCSTYSNPPTQNLRSRSKAASLRLDRACVCSCAPNGPLKTYAYDTRSGEGVVKAVGLNVNRPSSGSTATKWLGRSGPATSQGHRPRRFAAQWHCRFRRRPRKRATRRSTPLHRRRSFQRVIR